MAKKYTKIPIFGWNCRSCGHVLVDKTDKSTTNTAVELAIKSMRDGTSLVLFPEGRRSSDPYTMLPFKTGAFRIAQQTNIPILPITIKGSGKALPVGGYCSPANIEIVIGEPVYIHNNYDNIKDHPAINNVREFIKNNLSECTNNWDKTNKDK
jgi:1-acyl-sn-glycerol-3-phosphate acyltransferase